MIDPKLLNKGKRCHLLTGSGNVDNDIMGCPCEYNFNCPLTFNEKEELKNHPEVKERARLNLLAWKQQQTKE